MRVASESANHPHPCEEQADQEVRHLLQVVKAQTLAQPLAQLHPQ